MDPRFHGFSGSVNGGFQFGNKSVNVVPDGKLINGSRFKNVLSEEMAVNGGDELENSLLDENFGGIKFLLNNDPSPSCTVPSLSGSGEEEDCDLSDSILGYISQVLMEEDMDDQTCMLQESLGLQAAEKSFYDVLGKKYPRSPEQELTYVDHYVEKSDEYFFSQNENTCTSSSGNGSNNGVSGFGDSPLSHFKATNAYEERQFLWQFRKGVEEANKFLPNDSKFLHNFQPQDLVKDESKKEVREFSSAQSRGRKNPFRDDDDDQEEERTSKQPAIFPDPTFRTEEFDMILLNSMGDGQDKLHEYCAVLQSETSKKAREPKVASKGKGRGKKQSKKKKEVIDLRTLLITCAQAVAADDQMIANELLKQIRQHSSPYGDGSQRLAHCFADGLEARLAGTGCQIHKALLSKKTSAADYIKAYHLYLASCPFRRISNFVSNKTIRDIAEEENATRIHIIDFGILYGFQWPTFFQRIESEKCGLQRVRITGIEFPQPGFKPAQRIEETGKRLEQYAKRFKVEFEYTSIAKRWEAITLQDLNLDKDDFVAVNCLYRTKNLLDETVMEDSPRNIVLNLIRKINPNVFIHGIVNGAYNAPFFVTRFREALFHFSSLFDMLDTNVARERSERMLIEREIFGREALNVIACEGWERVERPETYKQWHVRNLKAGFRPIPIARQIIKKAAAKVSLYHKDFVVDEDGQWLLQGWKGRTIYAISVWKPV